MDNFIILLTNVHTKKAGEMTEQMGQMSRKERMGDRSARNLGQKDDMGEGFQGSPKGTGRHIFGPLTNVCLVR